MLPAVSPNWKIKAAVGVTEKTREELVTRVPYPFTNPVAVLDLSNVASCRDSLTSSPAAVRKLKVDALGLACMVR